MKSIFFLLSALISIPAFASEPGGCQKCVRIRAENERKAKYQNWEYFEDYQKLKEEGKISFGEEEDGALDPVGPDDSEER